MERLERTLPPPLPSQAQQFLSIDGTMVPLVSGEWAEARTLVIGQVLPLQEIRGATVAQTAQQVETYRRPPSTTYPAWITSTPSP